VKDYPRLNVKALRVLLPKQPTGCSPPCRSRSPKRPARKLWDKQVEVRYGRRRRRLRAQAVR